MWSGGWGCPLPERLQLFSVYFGFKARPSFPQARSGQNKWLHLSNSEEVIIAVGGERLPGRGGHTRVLRGCVPTGEAAPLPPGPAGSGVDGHAALPQPRSARAEPRRGFNCDPLKATGSLRCAFMTTRGFPLVHAVEPKSGDIEV